MARHSIFRKTLNYVLLMDLIWRSSIYKKRAFIVGTPIHGNLGDQAILQSELNFFSNRLQMKPIPIESYLASTKVGLLKKIIRNDTIYIHGGGFMGSLWPEEEEMFRKIIKTFPNNKIIVLPQTCYFEGDKSSTFMESKSVYESHDDITYIMRERRAYDYMRKNFPSCKIELIPDMVLSEQPTDIGKKREGILCCFRNDKEKVFDGEENIIRKLKCYKKPIRQSDTIIHKKVFFFNRRRVLKRKLMEFSRSELVVTDRLHGMVFAYITKTPCLAIDNKSHKVLGLYEWIKKSNYIRVYSANSFRGDIEELLNIAKKEPAELSSHFNRLSSIILSSNISGRKEENA